MVDGFRFADNFTKFQFKSDMMSYWICASHPHIRFICIKLFLGLDQNIDIKNSLFLSNKRYTDEEKIANNNVCVDWSSLDIIIFISLCFYLYPLCIAFHIVRGAVLMLNGTVRRIFPPMYGYFLYPTDLILKDICAQSCSSPALIIPRSLLC